MAELDEQAIAYSLFGLQVHMLVRATHVCACTYAGGRVGGRVYVCVCMCADEFVRAVWMCACMRVHIYVHA